MDLQIAGKAALVTGSSAGIGLAIARKLATEGARVILSGRDRAKLDGAVGGILSSGAADVTSVVADITTPGGAEFLLRRAPEVDILVNNLGIYEAKPFAAITDADWQHYFDVNVMSGVRLARHYLPAMVKRDWGRIVFISSESGLNIPVEMIHYGMTKTAQLAISRGLAESVAGTGVTVNAVLPGPTRSEGVVDFLDKLNEGNKLSQKEREAKLIAEGRPSSIIRRLATPEEVANMVVYVCSPLASATTGAALRVDGGVVRSIA